VKSRIEVEYISICGSDEVRRAVGAAVRYTENKLRALLGVKSRLAVKDLPIEYRAIIDRYFGKYMEAEAKRQREAARPAYERLYEAPSVGLSLEGAREIEALSWQTTARLVECEDEIVYAPGINIPDSGKDDASLIETEIGISGEISSSTDSVPSGATSARSHSGDECTSVTALPNDTSTANADLPLSDEELNFLLALLRGDTVMTDTPIETVVERINEIFLDCLGDIIIEMNDAPLLIEDYREDIEEWICRIHK
jgi:hypothetical protein